LLRFWLLKINNISPADWRQWYQQCMDHVMDKAAQPAGGKPNSTNPSTCEFRYKTLQASKWPCSCRYIYGGISKRHRFLQYGQLDQPTFNIGNLPSAGTRDEPGQAGNWVNTLIDGLGRDLLAKARMAPDKNHALPDYVVANEYPDASRCIGEHSDADPLFGALDNESVIFSFNISRDGIFCIKPNGIYKEFGQFAGITKHNKQDWVIPVYAPENSVIIMGGFCQQQCVHYTLTNDAVVAGSAPELQGPLGQKARTEFMEAGRYCAKGTPRQAWNLKRVAVVAPAKF